jgi:two-component system nitrogen regulation sensor histidine kinase NtrY
LIALLIVNLTLVLALGALIAWRLTRLWAERRSGSAGARLHVRLVTMFSVIAVVPAILVAIFATVTLNLGVEAWFSATVRSALESAVNVTHRYGDEKQDLIVADARRDREGHPARSAIVRCERQGRCERFCSRACRF